MEDNKLPGDGYARRLNEYEKIMLQAGSDILLKSLDNGREFCKFMTTTALGSIPIYISLLTLGKSINIAIPNATTLSTLLILFPCGLYIIASVLYILGYFPRSGSLSLDLPDQIEAIRTSLIKSQKQYIFTATVVYFFGLVVSIVLLTSATFGS